MALPLVCKCIFLGLVSVLYLPSRVGLSHYGILGLSGGKLNLKP